MARCLERAKFVSQFWLRKYKTFLMVVILSPIVRYFEVQYFSPSALYRIDPAVHATANDGVPIAVAVLPRG